MEKYKEYYRFHEISQFKCPRCDTGTLVGDEKNLSKKNTAEYENYQRAHGPDPEFASSRISGVFDCSNSRCSESISFVAESRVSEEYEPDSRGSYDVDYVSMYRPLLFDPPIHIIGLSENYPKFVKKCLNDCFKVFWIDPSSCGNRIRVALEGLLTHFKVPRINVKKKTPKSLHERIEYFKKKYPKYNKYADNLLAIKWLGNTASHRELSHNDVFKAFQILDYVLEEIFNNRTEKIKELSKIIVDSKGKRTTKSHGKPPF